MAGQGEHDANVQEAINRALAAEREASATVTRCEQEAASTLRLANEQAQQIQQRAERRIRCFGGKRDAWCRGDGEALQEMTTIQDSKTLSKSGVAG